MDQSMIKGMAVGGIAMVVLGAGAVTGYQKLAQPKVADVVAVKEVLQTVSTPQVRCENVQVRRQAPVRDEHRIAGTVIGGVAGGLLGNQIGGGNGKKVATVAGAVAGGYAGNRVQKNLQENDVVTTTEQRCKTVQKKSQRLVGYDVTYRLNGQEGRTRTSFEPGPTLPVKDGRVVVTPPPAEARS
ncbi:glycine zipper 2TM domain-containing protein [Hydrogenophaga luteola]|uniref:Glycine zipper 2TM domain-containing protein n=1 Tax=Hydrogenophaga luteola TaxID=1591122 RepID=A0ABV7W0J6_9BURK